MADETAAKEALQVAYSSAQKDLVDLEGATVAACQELEGEGGSSGSSVTSRLRLGVVMGHGPSGLFTALQGPSII